MKTPEIDKRLIKIAEYYGLASQSNILQEECAELIQAVSKYRRKSEPDVFDKMHIEEEIADVEIMITQIKYLMKISNSDIKAIKDSKLERQLERMKNESEEKDDTDDETEEDKT